MKTAALAEKPATHVRKDQNEKGWFAGAVACCFLYGLALIVLIHTTADGSWFWYATALRHGQHLYRDLHLPLQPMYPVELALLQAMFGGSWLAQQSIGVFNLIVLLVALTLVTSKFEMLAWQRALIFCCTFVTCMTFIMMRFDDFHVVATSLDLLSAFLLLNLKRSSSTRVQVGTYSLLGTLCGICMLVRINDGAFLFCSVLLASAVVAIRYFRQPLLVLLLPVVTLLLVLVVIFGLGETPHDWWFYSIHTAAAIKGGSGHLLLYPFRLPLGTLRELSRDWRTLGLSAYALVVAGAAWLLVTKKFTANQRYVVLGLALLPLFPFARNIARGNAARVLVAFVVLAIYGSTILVLYRLYLALRNRAPATWKPSEMVLLIPLGQLISISLSGARWYPNTNPSAALMIVLLPAALPWVLRNRTTCAILFSWAALLTVSAGIDKIRNPFDWFNYRAHSFNAARLWLQHPAFGPMLIERQQAELMQPVCSAVQQKGRQAELLSLPFSFANYFCDIPPWHGYVQTFYDLSGPDTIKGLEGELLESPPQWIVYQRQLDILSRNEEAFNQGKPLPHRALDALIMAKLSSHEWRARSLPKASEDTSTWLLIETRPDGR